MKKRILCRRCNYKGYLQAPVTLLEYSMSGVTEGIDAIASTRVVIGGENEHFSTHALTGEKIRRTFRFFPFIESS